MGRVRFTLEQFITRFRDTELKDNRGGRGYRPRNLQPANNSPSVVSSLNTCSELLLQTMILKPA
jgi:hypothetical protein